MYTFRHTCSIVLLAISALHAQAQGPAPKYEFRGAWVATVSTIDWPYTSGTESQKAELSALFDTLKNAGVNAVMFQIRPACDAFYESDLEPWSVWLTGTQGRAPEPFYDPLEFAVEEAHKRGMELHAWFNPFRARADGYPLADNHVINRHPEWILDCSTTGKMLPPETSRAVMDDPVVQAKLAVPGGTWIMLNPGIEAVRDYVVDVYMDVAARYDVDGLHMDDYFYPYSGMGSQDQASFQADRRGFNNIADWRRDNINLFVKAVYDSIQTAVPHMKFGVSPFGIYRNGVPSGIIGLDAWSVIYCDAFAWLRNGSVDYLVPQLYWPYGGGQDYGKLQPWWASQIAAYESHFYAGQAAYRIATWPNSSEMPNQLRLNRSQENCQGSIFFSANHFRTNPKGFADSLKQDFYRYPALTPVMAWRDQAPPSPPGGLRFEQLPGQGVAGLVWEAPPGEEPARYAVYRFTGPEPAAADFENAEHLLALTSSTSFLPRLPQETGVEFYYAVTAVSSNSIESTPTQTVNINAPGTVMLLSPLSTDPPLGTEVTFTWNYAPGASSYTLDISADSDFSNVVRPEAGISDTVWVWDSPLGMTTYYWRVRAVNGFGPGTYSDTGTFSTGFPLSPELIYPQDNVGNIETQPVFTWQKGGGNPEFRLQIAASYDFRESAMLADSTAITDTLFTGLVLEHNKFHFWRVRAQNSLGESGWSNIHRFKTVAASDVDDEAAVPAALSLHANYPNPFNASTIITYDLPEKCRVVLEIYTVLGGKAAVLVESEQTAGTHRLEFDAKGLPSGVYFVRLSTVSGVLTRKMILSR